MRHESIAWTLDEEEIGCAHDGAWPTEIAWQAPRPGSGMDSFVGNLAHRCGAARMLVLWQAARAEAQILSSTGPGEAGGGDFLAYHARAFSAAASSNASFKKERFQSRAADGYFTAAIALDGGTVTLAGFIEQSDDNAMEECRASLESLLPLIRPYYEQWLLAQRTLARMQSLSQAIDCSGMATILLGEDAEIIHANTAAERIFADKDGLRRSGGRLACATFSDTLRLHSAIDHLRAETANGSGLTPVLAMPRAKRRPLTLALTATRPGLTGMADGVCAIAYAFDPEQDLTGIVGPVCRLHGLSHSEAKLTCALVAGQSLGMAAQKLGVREQTARSYLKQIFAKTETNRQAELVQLMLKSSIRLSYESGVRAFA